MKEYDQVIIENVMNYGIIIIYAHTRTHAQCASHTYTCALPYTHTYAHTYAYTNYKVIASEHTHTRIYI